MGLPRVAEALLRQVVPAVSLALLLNQGGLELVDAESKGAQLVDCLGA